MKKIQKLIKTKRGVSPVIAVVLMIALVVAATATFWVITSGILDKSTAAYTVVGSGTGDTNGNQLGDYITVRIRNLGGDAGKVSEFSITRNGFELSTWTLVQSQYDLPAGQVAELSIQTTTGAEEVNNNHTVAVRFKDSVSGDNIYVEEVNIPPVLSALPVIFEGLDFSNIDINAQGWTSYLYGTHGGGGAGFVVDNGDILFNTNNDYLFYLANDDYKVRNGIISADFLNGDDDGIGVAFRIQDTTTYYWIGFTNDHNGPNNRAGENEASFTGPWFNYDARFELHLLNGGVDTILANAVPPFTIQAGSATNLRGPYKFIIAFNDDIMTFQAAGTDGVIHEIFTVQDSTISSSGYFGVFSLAAQASRLDSFTVTA